MIENSASVDRQPISGNTSRPDFSNVPDSAVKELHRQGELCLLGTMQLALAADQRATTLSGILGAGAVALAAATAGLNIKRAS